MFLFGTIALIIQILGLLLAICVPKQDKKAYVGKNYNLNYKKDLLCSEDIQNKNEFKNEFDDTQCIVGKKYEKFTRRYC